MQTCRFAAALVTAAALTANGASAAPLMDWLHY
jgi:hypothetical protein